MGNQVVKNFIKHVKDPTPMAFSLANEKGLLADKHMSDDLLVQMRIKTLMHKNDMD